MEPLITKLSWDRPIWGYSKVQFLYSTMIRGRKIQLRNKNIKSKAYLNVGCGPNAHPGFINLDYHWLPKEVDFERVKQKQVQVFQAQFALAQANDLPVIIHCRKAHDDLMEVLTDLTKDKSKPELGVVHNYYGSFNRAAKYIELGFLISFTGLITYNDSCDSLIRRLPIEKIMLETDCPYMAPEPKKGSRNEPLYIKYILEKFAKIKNIPTEEAARITTENARRLFGL